MLLTSTTPTPSNAAAPDSSSSRSRRGARGLADQRARARRRAAHHQVPAVRVDAAELEPCGGPGDREVGRPGLELELAQEGEVGEADGGAAAPRLGVGGRRSRWRRSSRRAPRSARPRRRGAATPSGCGRRAPRRRAARSRRRSGTRGSSSAAARRRGRRRARVVHRRLEPATVVGDRDRGAVARPARPGPRPSRSPASSCGEKRDVVTCPTGLPSATHRGALGRHRAVGDREARPACSRRRARCTCSSAHGR